MVKTAVLMATYNGGKLLKRQLDSIKNQTLSPDYVIIRDDGSTDNSVSFVKKYIKDNNLSNWSIKVNPKNLGWRKNFRKLILDDAFENDSDIIFLSDQDDTWDLDKNKKQVQLLEKNKKIDLLTCDSRLEVSEDAVTVPNFYQFLDKENEFSLFPFDYAYSSFRGGRSMAIRKSLLNDMKPFWKEEYNTSHDVILNKMASCLRTGYNLNQELITHFRHANNASGGSYLKARDKKEVHVAELYKNLGFYAVIYQVMRARKADNIEIIEKYYNFYNKRYELARGDRNLSSLLFLFQNWKLYPSMGNRLRDFLFALKKQG